MKVYRINGETKPHRIQVTPGFFHQDVAEWIDKETKKPFAFVVVFKNGIAEVPDNLGHYLLDNKMVQRSPLILPTESH